MKSLSLIAPSSAESGFVSPKEISAFSWTLVPCVLVLLNSALPFLKPCCFTPYTPILALIALLLPVRFKARGLIATCAVLVGVFFWTYVQEQMDLWQMGVLAAFGLNSVIAHLSFEQQQETWVQATASFQQQESSLKEQLQRFEEEIERLKEEAEQRRIDKIADEEKIALITTEIEWLTAQKEQFLNEVTQNPQLEGLYKQLRAQFEEKSLVLQQTRKALFKAEGELEALALEKRQRVEPIGEEAALQQQLCTLMQDSLDLEEEITALEELISHVLSQ